MKFATKAIHAGQEPDPSTGAIMTPIYQTSTYVQESPGKNKGYAYARGKNPTRSALEKNLAALENASYGICFSSGMGAEDAIIKLLLPGDEVIAADDLYGGTYRMFEKIYAPFGIKFHYVNMSDAKNISNYITEKTKMIWVETPTNPTMKIIDIAACAAIVAPSGSPKGGGTKNSSEEGKTQKIILVVDNTFASPYLQNPLNLGADIVVHSATKYLGGHSDVVMGAICTNDENLYNRLSFIQNSTGANPGPMDSFLVLRGIKTLHVRMDRHCYNGRKVAEFLKSHPKIETIYWPGFPDHANHDIAKKQMKDFGGMLSFSMKGNSKEEAFKMASGMKVFSLAESLGGVESLIGHPASMTHAAIPKEEREKSGVVDSLLRLSIGIEDAEDLIADLKQALDSVR